MPPKSNPEGSPNGAVLTNAKLPCHSEASVSQPIQAAQGEVLSWELVVRRAHLNGGGAPLCVKT